MLIQGALVTVARKWSNFRMCTVNLEFLIAIIIDTCYISGDSKTIKPLWNRINLCSREGPLSNFETIPEKNFDPGWDPCQSPGQLAITML